VTTKGPTNISTLEITEVAASNNVDTSVPNASRDLSIQRYRSLVLGKFSEHLIVSLRAALKSSTSSLLLRISKKCESNTTLLGKIIVEWDR